MQAMTKERTYTGAICAPLLASPRAFVFVYVCVSASVGAHVDVCVSACVGAHMDVRARVRACA